MGQVLGARLWFGAAFTLVLATASWAQPERSAEARATVAQALYAASATAAAEQRLADARISQQRREIETLRTQTATNAAMEASARARLQSQLADAQERFVQQLAERDRPYAQEIAVFRGAVQNIVSTPEGEAACANSTPATRRAHWKCSTGWWMHVSGHGRCGPTSRRRRSGVAWRRWRWTLTTRASSEPIR